MIGFGVQMLARARLRRRLLVDVLDGRGKYRMLVGDYAFADDELQFRYKVHDELPVRTERIMKRIAPCGQFVFTLTQERTDKALEGLGER